MMQLAPPSLRRSAREREFIRPSLRLPTAATPDTRYPPLHQRPNARCLHRRSPGLISPKRIVLRRVQRQHIPHTTDLFHCGRHESRRRGVSREWRVRCRAPIHRLPQHRLERRAKAVREWRPRRDHMHIHLIRQRPSRRIVRLLGGPSGNRHADRGIPAEVKQCQAAPTPANSWSHRESPTFHADRLTPSTAASRSSWLPAMAHH